MRNYKKVGMRPKDYKYLKWNMKSNVNKKKQIVLLDIKKKILESNSGNTILCCL